MKLAVFLSKTTCKESKNLWGMGKVPWNRSPGVCLSLNMQKTTKRTTQPVLASLREKDSCFLLKDESFAFIQEKNPDGTFECTILNQRYTTTLFHQPCSSKFLNIVCTGNGQGRMKRGLLHKTDLIRKVACLPQETGGYVLIPLRHGMEHKC